MGCAVHFVSNGQWWPTTRGAHGLMTGHGRTLTKGSTTTDPARSVVYPHVATRSPRAAIVDTPAACAGVDSCAGGERACVTGGFTQGQERGQCEWSGADGRPIRTEEIDRAANEREAYLYVCAHLPAGVTEHKLSPKAAARQQPPRRAPMHHRSAVRAPGPRHVGAKRHASGAQVYLDDLRRHPPNVRTPTAARVHRGRGA
jgi:hypothetical protein